MNSFPKGQAALNVYENHKSIKTCVATFYGQSNKSKCDILFILIYMFIVLNFNIYIKITHMVEIKLMA